MFKLLWKVIVLQSFQIFRSAMLGAWIPLLNSWTKTETCWKYVYMLFYCVFVEGIFVNVWSILFVILSSSIEFIDEGVFSNMFLANYCQKLCNIHQFSYIHIRTNITVFYLMWMYLININYWIYDGSMKPRYIIF